jgi:DNA polymerase-3 subunit gamma/tau
MKLADIAGNQPTIKRLRNGLRATPPPNLYLVHGPTGAGKTTLANCLSRAHFCENRIAEGDACGECDNCRLGLGAQSTYNRWTGAEIDQNFEWWVENRHFILQSPDHSLFFDEIHDLCERHQSYLLTDLESARCQIIFATSHVHRVNDAMQTRFGANVIELKRPSDPEVVLHLRKLCHELNVHANDLQLAAVVKGYKANLRQCTELIHAAISQAGSVISSDFLESVFGTQSSPIASTQRFRSNNI